MKNDGYLIALAWPETYCKQAGGWYDPLLSFLRISSNNYYKVGHAALVLVTTHQSEAHYFDFGRYHAPFGHGRVRSKLTDHELIIHTKLAFDSKGNILNLQYLLEEVANKEACHGIGPLHAGIYPVNVAKAHAKANELQQKQHIPYGPFLKNGSNCSRFVRDVMKAGFTQRLKKITLYLPLVLTPTPKGNVRLLKNKFVINPRIKTPQCAPEKKTKTALLSTLTPPLKPKNIPYASQWLSGEGAGSWFHISTQNERFLVERFSPEGQLECQGLFRSSKTINLSSEFHVHYPSNCQQISLIIKNELFQLEAIK